MIDSISRNITQALITRNIIDFDDMDIYLYGFQLLFATIFKGIGLIIIGYMLGYLTEILIFIGGFSTLRVSAGGYHHKSYLGCFIMTVIFALTSVLGGKIITNYGDFYITLGILFISSILVFIYAPVDTANKPFTETEYIRYRKASIAVIILQVIVIISVYLIKKDLALYCNVASLGILIESLTLVDYKKLFN